MVALPAQSAMTRPVMDDLDPELARFAAELGDLWPDLQPLTSPLDDAESDRLHEAARAAVRQSVNAADMAAHVRELDALRAGWTHFTPGQKAVLNAATAYVVDALDGVDDRPEAARWSDDVVTAAVRALLHRR